MFWGLILKANKKYTQVLEKPFHLSQAALDHSSCDDDEPIQVMYNHEDSSYLLCTLKKGSVMQCALDLNFAEGDKLCFMTRGSGIVHLTGFLLPDDEMNYGEFGSEEEEEEEEVELPDLREKLTKNKAVKDKKQGKAEQKKVQEESEEDSDDSDFQDESALQNEEDDDDDDDDDDSGEGEEEDEDDDDDDDEDESEEEIVPPKAKQQKLDPQQTKDKKQQNGVANGQEKKKNKENQQQQPKAGQMQKLQGGLMIQDLKVGNGAEAKAGKKIQVYYEGRLKSNNKVFDSTKAGPGFKMTLGRGEVIKGWDIGLTGMKVGGKRRLICPPQLAYGHKGNPPVIPANSTLVFDVELKNVL